MANKNHYLSLIKVVLAIGVIYIIGQTSGLFGAIAQKSFLPGTVSSGTTAVIPATPSTKKETDAGGTSKIAGGSATQSANNVIASATPDKTVGPGAATDGRNVPVKAAGGGYGCGGGTPKKIDATPNAPTPSKTQANEAQTIKTAYTLANDIAPNNFQVKVGVPVRFEIDAKESGQGCMSTLKIPGLYDQTQFLEGGKTMVIDFTPAKTGTYQITCAMGVPRGTITVN